MIVNKGPFMEFLLLKLTESAPNTYTDKVAATPASKSIRMAMLIHFISFHIGHADRPATEAQTTDTTAQLVDRTMTNLKNQADPEVIAICQHSFRGLLHESAVGVFTIAESVSFGNRELIIYYDPPILYAKSQIWLGIKGTGNTLAKVGSCRVGYTLEEVTKDAFIDALVGVA